jgi:hypothetical protein
MNVENIVTHIELNRPGDRRSGICRIHGQTNGNRWFYTETEAIRMILGPGPAYTFWVLGVTQHPARVVVRGAWPYQFLKTEADSIHENNLLALPEWPYTMRGAG